MYQLTEKNIARFMSHCYTDEEGIMRWGGRLDKYGYGIFTRHSAATKSNQTMFAHRIAMQLWGPPQPHNKPFVLHNMHGVENRNVIDIRFLRWGTQKENMHDKIAAGTSNRGQRAANNKLSDAQVLGIYRRAWDGEGIRALAREYGVNQGTVSCIKSGRNWGWLTGHTVSIHMTAEATLTFAAD